MALPQPIPSRYASLPAFLGRTSAHLSVHQAVVGSPSPSRTPAGSSGDIYDDGRGGQRARRAVGGSPAERGAQAFERIGEAVGVILAVWRASVHSNVINRSVG